MTAWSMDQRTSRQGGTSAQRPTTGKSLAHARTASRRAKASAGASVARVRHHEAHEPVPQPGIGEPQGSERCERPAVQQRSEASPPSGEVRRCGPWRRWLPRRSRRLLPGLSPREAEWRRRRTRGQTRRRFLPCSPPRERAIRQRALRGRRRLCVWLCRPPRERAIRRHPLRGRRCPCVLRCGFPRGRGFGPYDVWSESSATEALAEGERTVVVSGGSVLLRNCAYLVDTPRAGGPSVKSGVRPRGVERGSRGACRRRRRSRGRRCNRRGTARGTSRRAARRGACSRECSSRTNGPARGIR